MNTPRFVSRALLAIGLFYCSMTSAAPPEPPKQMALAASTAASIAERVTPEEAKRRKDWADSMHKKPAPKKGCFTANYPNPEWQEIPCVPTPQYPAVPRLGVRPFVVGNANDISAQAPSGNIAQAIGHFDVVNVTSESGPIANSGPPVNDAYTLQINTNNFSSSVCAGSPNAGCLGWQQFVYANDGTAGVLYIQYWIIHYDANCPAGQNWIQFPYNGGIYCYKNNTAGGTPVPNQPITNLGNLTFSGTVSSSGDAATLSTPTQVFTRTGDNAVNAANGWTTAEFNVFGDGGNTAGGGMASFNSGASIVTRTEIIYGGNAAPGCSAQGFTGETNNLSFGPTAPAATAPGPAVTFSESTAGGASSNCAAASTIGDTHLRTFDGLFYDFQATGDFTLAEVSPGFEVQTRQVSGAPTWPNATVNKAVAARINKTQVAICLGNPGTDQPTRVFVDGKVVTLNDGKTVALSDAVALVRQGNVYMVASERGDSLRATVNASWIDVSVGLGFWPSKVHGLIANAHGNVNQIETRDHVVLSNPFNFDELYRRFADSWRVSGDSSMLSVCGTGAVERGAPGRAFFVGDLEPMVREKARGVCETAGVKAGPLLDACMLDVAVIGQDAAAKVFVGQPMPAAVGAVKGDGHTIGSILRIWWWLILLLLLVFILIIWLLIQKKP